MKIGIIAALIFLLDPTSGYSLNAYKFFNALETNNIEQILNNIEVSPSLSIREISKFFQDIKQICEIRYGVSISLSQVQEDILEICRQNIFDTEDLRKVELFLDELFNPENINANSQCIFLASSKKQKHFFLDKNIPVNVILGCIEIGCGALLWVTPFRTVGNILIGDGCRRMFNEAEVKGKARNYYHNMFQKLMNSGTILYAIY